MILNLSVSLFFELSIVYNPELTDTTKDASSEVISVNRKVIMEEIDTETVFETLKRNHYDTNQIVGNTVKEHFMQILEKHTEHYLETLLDVLRDYKREYLFSRLNKSIKVFSVDLGK